jgi:hypothetical protein
MKRINTERKHKNTLKIIRVVLEKKRKRSGDMNNNFCDYCGQQRPCMIINKWSRDRHFLVNRSYVSVCNSCKLDMLNYHEIYKHDDKYLLARDATSQAKF